MTQMIPMQPPAARMITIYHAKTGEAIERWPVDARGMIACGEYRLDPPVDPEAAAEAQDEALETPEQEPYVAPGTPARVHPLSTGEVAVPLTLGEATEAHPVEIPAVGEKRGPGRPRKFPTK